jgi:curved DNA-binding protein CbpA
VWEYLDAVIAPHLVLGVSENASPHEIRRAYRRRARELHPDVNDDPDAAWAFGELRAAYEALMARRGLDP